MKRLGIFVFYNKKGVVDDYAKFLLEEVRNNVSKFIIICNGELNDHNKSILARYSSEVIVRENVGFDAGAWRYAIVEKLGKSELMKYDELLLLNDTFFGPFYPLSKVFEEMDKRDDSDFWGITEHGSLPEVNVTAHIQTYFIVVRKTMLDSESFFSYWENMYVATDIKKAITYNEIFFTQYFEKKGFKRGVFCNTRALKSLNYYIVKPYMLLKEYRCPILKKKALILNSVDREAMRGICTVEERYKALWFVAQNTKYPIKYILKNIWDNYDMKDIVLCLGLTFPVKWERLLKIQKSL